MAKMTLKDKMVEVMVKAGAKIDDEGVYTITESAFEKAKVEIEETGKFVVKGNKKDNKLFAIAYASKPSQRLIVVRVVADKKVAKTEKLVARIKIETKMLKDRGFEVHFCEVNVAGGGKELLDKFYEVANRKFIETGLLGQIDSIEAKTETAAVIALPKIKGHSKDGYALYKKCMVEAKRELRIAQ